MKHVSSGARPKEMSAHGGSRRPSESRHATCDATGQENETMLFRQLYDSESSTYTYLLADEETREAVIIDPVLEHLERDVGLIAELGLTLKNVLDTHVHADHVTAAGALRQRLGATTVVSERGGAPCADLQVKHGDVIRFGRYALEVRRPRDTRTAASPTSSPIGRWRSRAMRSS
jgi:hypothetical protein